MDKEPKMVIIIRRKYPDGHGGLKNVRAGKLMAQVCHVSEGLLLDLLKPMHTNPHHRQKCRIEMKATLCDFDVEYEYYSGRHKKVVVGVDTIEELLEIEKIANSKGIRTYRVTDAGLTEFGGEPTITALGLGPDLPEKIDPLTGHLPLV